MLFFHTDLYIQIDVGCSTLTGTAKLEGDQKDTHTMVEQLELASLQKTLHFFG